MFAKCPANGRPKTRLQPPLTQAEAAVLHMQLATRTLQVLQAASGYAPTLWLDQPSEHPWVHHMQATMACPVSVQCPGDLGERMGHALNTALQHHAFTILVGSDCPVLAVEHLQHIAKWLHDGCDAAFIPAEDGGYVLVGLRRYHPALFSGIQWSMAGVMQQTRARLQQLDWRWGELEPLWDVDTPDDLDRLKRARIDLPVLNLCV